MLLVTLQLTGSSNLPRVERRPKIRTAKDALYTPLRERSLATLNMASEDKKSKSPFIMTLRDNAEAEEWLKGGVQSKVGSVGSEMKLDPA